MPIFITINLAIKALLTNKGRALLTMLGIIIGISSVIIIISAGQGAKSTIMKELEGMNANIISVNPGTLGMPGTTTDVFKYQYYENASRPGFFKYIREHFPANMWSGYVSYKDTIKSGSVIGSTSTCIEVMGYKISNGRFFSSFEDKKASNVAILGGKIAKDLFENEDPVGKTVKILNQNWKIIGLLESKGGFGMYDSYIMAPYNSVALKLLNRDYLDEWDFVAIDKEAIKPAVEEIKLYLRKVLNIKPQDDDNFILNTAEDGLSMLNTVLFYLTVFLTLIASISLLVGGIGIMNIMLVSVTERTKEIGLRKAIGAKYWDILKQFLIESIILTLIGGIIGIIVGSMGSILVAQVGNWPPDVPWYALAISVGTSTVIGGLFGFYPAQKAAKLDPIEALRSE